MKKFIFPAIFASILSFNSHAYLIVCSHGPGSPNEDWTTEFHINDNESWNNAVNACLNDGGNVIQSEQFSDLWFW